MTVAKSLSKVTQALGLKIYAAKREIKEVKNSLNKAH